MKLYQIKKDYGLNTNAFYNWLRETEMIERSPSGHVVGPNAMEGMETLLSKRVSDDGEIIVSSQVMMDDDKIPDLIKAFEQSGEKNLYTRRRFNTKFLEELSQDLSHALHRIEVLENQLLILTKQVVEA